MTTSRAIAGQPVRTAAPAAGAESAPPFAHLRLLQVGMTLMVSLSGIVLGMGQQSWLLAGLAVTAAAGGLYFTDVRKSFWLRRWQAFLCAWIALAVAVNEAARLEADLRLLAVANLLLYLQAILLFHRKTSRVYWELALLSLMQALVAAALNDRITFAFLLAAYFAAGIVAMTAFLLYRESLAVAGSDMRRTRRTAIGAHVPSPSAQPAQNGRASRRAQPPRAVPPAWTGVPPEAVPGNVLGWSLARHVLRIGVITLLLTAGLFLAVPRVGKTSWNRRMGEVKRTVGFGERVMLGELGELSEDPAAIMQVRFFRHGTGEEYQVRDPLYLRGSSLTVYEGGSWRHDREGDDRPFEGGRLPFGDFEIVEQWTTIEPLDNDALPAVFPVYPLPDTVELQYDGLRERLARPLRSRNAQVSYKVATTGLRAGRQVPIAAGRRPELEWGRLDESQTLELSELKRLADEVVAGIPEGDAYARAKALEAHFQESGRYQYTLQGQPVPENVDPIEDFVARSRRGNCEYFASALVLMLRSQGIPARMAVGFHAPSFNPLGRFYHVQQLHSHTWVEAHLERDQVPAELAGVWRGRGWLRLDPTPQSEAAAATVSAIQDDRWPTPQEMWEYCRFLWANYVVGLDADKQREAIYKPLLEAVRAGAQNVADRDAWASFGRGIADFLAGRGRLPVDWRSGALAALVALAVGLATRRLWRRQRRIRESRTEPAAARARPTPPPVPFYERLEALLEPRHLVRGPGQTQREFARAAAARLADEASLRDVASLPAAVVEAFYRVRFGHQGLDSAEAERVEQALAALTAAFAPPPAASNGAAE